jgi:hypothetical protein
MLASVTGKLLQGAAGAMSAAAGAVRHAAWLVSYHVDGPVRHSGPQRERRPARTERL